MNKEKYDKSMVLPLGKVENHLLREIVFKNTGFKHPLVLERSKVGEDTACIKSEIGKWIVSTDPITAAATKIGSLAINISCNDIATRGIRPIAMTIAVMLPKGSTLGDLENIMVDASKTANKMNVEIVGGHTEVTEAVNTPVIVSTAMGFEEEIARHQASEGDLILMTKSAGIEGGGILAWEKDILKEKLTKEEMLKARNLIEETSVVTEGELAGRIGFVKMHDITEGGVLGGVWEICESLNLGCQIDEKEIFVEPVVKKISEVLQIDYLKLISSGSMLIVIKEKDLPLYEKELNENKIKFSLIGRLKSKEYGKFIKSIDNQQVEILSPEKDELYVGLGA